jgi:hypothetical protein
MHGRICREKIIFRLKSTSFSHSKLQSHMVVVVVDAIGVVMVATALNVTIVL